MMDSHKVESVFQLIIGIFGLFINTLVIFCLSQCSTLSFFTLSLMKSQCVANLIGSLAPIVFYSPWSLFFSQNFLTPGSLAMNVVGSFLVLSVYSQFALQAVMATNRLCVFRFQHKVKQWFPPNRVKIIIGFCMLYGACHAIAALFPCCNITYISTPGRWAPNGTNSNIQLWVQLRVQLAGDMLTFPTVIVCHTVVLFSIEMLRQQAQNRRITRTNFKTEMRIMIQFCIVAAMWLIYCGFFRLLQFVPAARKWSSTRLIVEFSRYMFLVIDPTLNLLFLKQLRQFLYNKLTCQHPVRRETSAEQIRLRLTSTSLRKAHSGCDQMIESTCSSMITRRVRAHKKWFTYRGNRAQEEVDLPTRKTTV